LWVTGKKKNKEDPEIERAVTGIDLSVAANSHDEDRSSADLDINPEQVLSPLSLSLSLSDTLVRLGSESPIATALIHTRLR
jgi:hypothetical protein